jgi:DNA helicase II / ATP-dependent DNA helicase PcrA
LKSTKESAMNAGPYVEALLSQGLSVYNPRNKAFMEQEEVQGLLGALLAILDSDRRYAQDPANRNAVPRAESNIRSTYDRLAATSQPLSDYTQQARASIRAKQGEYFDCQLQELVYYLLSLEPFSRWEQDPVRRIRLGRLTKLLEAYASLPILDPATGLPRPNVNRGLLRASDYNLGEVYGSWLGAFYHLFIGYVTQTGFDDEEVEEVICPADMVPVMTIHQSKGLEFPFVFVGHMGGGIRISASHELETLFSAFPTNPARIFMRPPIIQRAEMDLIRQYYVAYSRAKYALILLGTRGQFSASSVPLGPNRNWVRNRTLPL